MNRGAWRAAVHGVAKSGTRLSNFTSTLFQRQVCAGAQEGPKSLSWNFFWRERTAGMKKLKCTWARFKFRRLTNERQSVTWHLSPSSPVTLTAIYSARGLCWPLFLTHTGYKSSGLALVPGSWARKPPRTSWAIRTSLLCWWGDSAEPPTWIQEGGGSPERSTIDMIKRLRLPAAPPPWTEKGVEAEFNPVSSHRPLPTT